MRGRNPAEELDRREDVSRRTEQRQSERRSRTDTRASIDFAISGGAYFDLQRKSPAKRRRTAAAAAVASPAIFRAPNTDTAGKPNCNTVRSISYPPYRVESRARYSPANCILTRFRARVRNDGSRRSSVLYEEGGGGGGRSLIGVVLIIRLFSRNRVPPSLPPYRRVRNAASKSRFAIDFGDANVDRVYTRVNPSTPPPLRQRARGPE